MASVNAFQELAAIKDGAALCFEGDRSACLLCPDMGGRVFGEVGGRSVHRLHLETVRRPDQPFANFGGNNFWPAPEGGPLGFNYRGSEWYVQPGINRDPFRVVAADARGAVLEKDVVLVNRAGTRVETRMRRAFQTLAAPPPGLLGALPLDAVLAYRTADSFAVRNTVAADAALLAAWTLEQFDATPDTVSFAAVAAPEAAINVAFYEPPRERLAFFPKGFTYRTDGRRKGQIGIRQAAEPLFIGCCDRARRLLILRRNESVPNGVFFNIADNDQPGGPFSAADTYSIFNSDPEMAAFELETIGAARVERGFLKGSELLSSTTIALVHSRSDLEAFVDGVLGQPGALASLP